MNNADSASSSTEALAPTTDYARPRAMDEVARVVQALREQAAHTEGAVRVYHADATGIVQRISREVAELAGNRSVALDIDGLMAALRGHLPQIGPGVQLRAVGTVQHIGHGVATLSGLPRSSTHELVTFSTGAQGMILNLERDHVDVIMLGAAEGIKGGDVVTATGERLRIPAGHQLLGRVVTPLGEPLDDRGTIDATYSWYLEHDAPGIVAREPVHQSLLTGWKVIDALIPIGRGQRELIVGDRQTGKTTLAVDAIINQKETDVACVYVAIGQKKSSTLAVIQALQEAGALDYTTVVMSGPDDPPALRYLAPYAGCTMAEGVMHEGRDVLIIYDDLTKHADAYRELSLLLRRPPGREAYPGDIFYLHSRLLERACKLNAEHGGGSLTAFPIVETQRGNVAGYIPTNLISITDGQIILDTELFNQGVKPAIDAGRSVSRVGGAAQSKAMRKVAANLRLELAQFEEVARFARFGTEVDAATQQQIRRGERLRKLLMQPAHRPLSMAAQVILLRAAALGVFDPVPTGDIPACEREFLDYVRTEHAALFYQLEREGVWQETMETTLAETAAQFSAQWRQSLGEDA